MARSRFDLPEQFPFSTVIPIRITDINYGNHVGNDTILSLVHEAMVQFLLHFGYSELNLDGVGMIMTEAAIEFKSELFYGDRVLASVSVSEFSRVGFTVYYKFEVKKGDDSGQIRTAAFARTVMVCYDYEKKKITAMPETVSRKLNGTQ